MSEIITIDLNCTESFCANLTDFYTEPIYVYNTMTNMILIASYIPLFLFSLISNVVLIIVVCKYICLRSVTNYFLVNLAVADLLVTFICMPMAVAQCVYSFWQFGDLICKLSHYLQGVAGTASVLTITAMSIDRFIAIRLPMSRWIFTRPTTIKVILLIWGFALLIFGPIPYIRKSEGFKFAWDSREFVYCVESWPDRNSQKTFGIFSFISIHLIPGIIVVVTCSLIGMRLCSRRLLPEYEGTDSNHSSSTNSSWQVSSAGNKMIRERRRVAKILLGLGLLFAGCWLPYSVTSLYLDSNAKDPPGINEEIRDLNSEADEFNDQIIYYANLLLPYFILLGHCQAALNPLLYFFLSKIFRKCVQNFIRHPIKILLTRPENRIRMMFGRSPAQFTLTKSKSLEYPLNSHQRNHRIPRALPKPMEISAIKIPQNLQCFRSQFRSASVVSLPQSLCGIDTTGSPHRAQNYHESKVQCQPYLVKAQYIQGPVPISVVYVNQ